jgi:hypothetical protein
MTAARLSREQTAVLGQIADDELRQRAEAEAERRARAETARENRERRTALAAEAARAEEARLSEVAKAEAAIRSFVAAVEAANGHRAILARNSALLDRPISGMARPAFLARVGNFLSEALADLAGGGPRLGRIELHAIGRKFPAWDAAERAEFAKAIESLKEETND